MDTSLAGGTLGQCLAAAQALAPPAAVFGVVGGSDCYAFGAYADAVAGSSFSCACDTACAAQSDAATAAGQVELCGGTLDGVAQMSLHEADYQVPQTGEAAVDACSDDGSDSPYGLLYQGCFDSAGLAAPKSALGPAADANDAIGNCRDAAAAAGSLVFGLSAGSDCSDYSLPALGGLATAAAGTCDTPCTGDAGAACGGASSTSLFSLAMRELTAQCLPCQACLLAGLDAAAAYSEADIDGRYTACATDCPAECGACALAAAAATAAAAAQMPPALCRGATPPSAACPHPSRPPPFPRSWRPALPPAGGRPILQGSDLLMQRCKKIRGQNTAASPLRRRCRQPPPCRSLRRPPAGPRARA
jgi:hypothetical protein